MVKVCDDENFHMTFIRCISAAKSDVPPLLILTREWLNRDDIEGCNIDGANITTPPNRFINSTLF